MKICISGSQCVGKSTVLNELKKHPKLQDFNFISEIVRNLIKEGVQINKGADHQSQIRILEEHYKNTWKFDKFITDRCSIDAFVYATWDYLHGNYTYDQHKIHEKMFLDSVNRYDYFFYIPVEFDIIPDGVRAADTEYQKEIDDLFREIYRRYELIPYKLTGTLENRVRQFYEALR